MKNLKIGIMVFAIVVAVFLVVGTFVNREPWQIKTASVIAGGLILLIIIGVLYYLGSV